tara:strand:+ start:463 stop:741 length:279 start_codon:yes stop_codon:yes gene_type:complete
MSKNIEKLKIKNTLPILVVVALICPVIAVVLYFISSIVVTEQNKKYNENRDLQPWEIKNEAIKAFFIVGILFFSGVTIVSIFSILATTLKNT